MTRLRDLSLVPGTLIAGQHNAITDVPGVRVGHTTLIGGDKVRTGVTAILPHGGNVFRHKVPAAVYTINGFGKPHGFEQVRELGRIETPILLTNTLNVGRVADAAISYTLRENPDIQSVNPLVGECNDSFLNDIQGRHVRELHVLKAIDSATGGTVAEGAVGAGTGTACYGFKGGIGTSSRHVGDYTVGALLQTNFGTRPELMMMGVPVGQQLADEFLPETTPPPGSVMIVLATDAPLTPHELLRLAKRAVHGLARTGSVAHHGSGDFVIAFSTQNQYTHGSIAPVETIHRVNDTLMDGMFTAVVESVEEAVYNSLIAAVTMTGYKGHTLHALPHDALLKILKV